MCFLVLLCGVVSSPWRDLLKQGAQVVGKLTGQDPREIEKRAAKLQKDVGKIVKTVSDQASAAVTSLGYDPNELKNMVLEKGQVAAEVISKTAKDIIHKSQEQGIINTFSDISRAGMSKLEQIVTRTLDRDTWASAVNFVNSAVEDILHGETGAVIHESGAKLASLLGKALEKAFNIVGDMSPDELKQFFSATSDKTKDCFNQFYRAVMENETLWSLIPYQNASISAVTKRYVLPLFKGEADDRVCAEGALWISQRPGGIELLKECSRAVYWRVKHVKGLKFVAEFDVQTHGYVRQDIRGMWNCWRVTPKVTGAVYRRISDRRNFTVVSVRGSGNDCESNEFLFGAIPVHGRGLNEKWHAMAQKRAKLVVDEVSKHLKGQKYVYFTGYGYGGAVAALACALYRNQTKESEAKAIVFSAGNVVTTEGNSDLKGYVMNILTNLTHKPAKTHTNAKRFVPPGCTYANFSTRLEAIDDYFWLVNEQKLYENPSQKVFGNDSALRNFKNESLLRFGPIPVATRAEDREPQSSKMIYWTKLNPDVVLRLANHAHNVYDNDEGKVDGAERVLTFERTVRTLTSWTDNFFIDKYTKVMACVYANHKFREVVVSVRGSNKVIDLVEYYLCSDQKINRGTNLKVQNVNLHSLVEKRAIVVYENVVYLVEQYEAMGYQVYFTGHSYGGAVAPLLCLLYRHEHPKSSARSVGFCSASVVVPEANHFFSDFCVNILRHGDVIPYLTPQDGLSSLVVGKTSYFTSAIASVIDWLVKTDERHLVPAGTSLEMKQKNGALLLSEMSLEEWNMTVVSNDIMKSLEYHNVEYMTGNITRYKYFRFPEMTLVSSLKRLGKSLRLRDSSRVNREDL